MPDRSHAIAGQPGHPRRVRGAPPVWDHDWAAARRAARGRRVARDLVELSRLQRGEERVDSAPFDLARLLRAICVRYGELDVSGPEPLPFRTDSRRLSRVLSTLLDNACLHGAPPITVRYDEAGIVVRDRGPGLAPTLLERATEPFVTGERVRGRGVGLGLAIAARQAALLGAELRLANAPDGGAIAELRFAPAQSASPPLPV